MEGRREKKRSRSTELSEGFHHHHHHHRFHSSEEIHSRVAYKPVYLKQVRVTLSINEGKRRIIHTMGNFIARGSNNTHKVSLACEKQLQGEEREEVQGESPKELLVISGSNDAEESHVSAYLQKGDFALVSRSDDSRQCRLHYKEFGDKNSPRKLLLIMGLSAPFTLWINQALYFSSLTFDLLEDGGTGQAFHVLVYDHRVRLFLMSMSLVHSFSN